LRNLENDFLPTGVLLLVWGLDEDGDPAVAIRSSTNDRLQILGALEALKARALHDAASIFRTDNDD
jgi:hypothetical protein